MGHSRHTIRRALSRLDHDGLGLHLEHVTATLLEVAAAAR